MFDIGFWELATLGVIALIVLGPERLPVVARTMGRWVARAKGYMNAITSELEREVKADEIRNEVKRAREQIESETRNVHNETRKSVEPIMKPLDDSAAKKSATASSPATGASTSQADPSGQAGRTTRQQPPTAAPASSSDADVTQPSKPGKHAVPVVDEASEKRTDSDDGTPHSS